MNNFYSPYTIPSPEPFYAGSYLELCFTLQNPWDDKEVDLTVPANIIFSMTLYGTYGDAVVKFDRGQKFGGYSRISIDPEHKDTMTVRLFNDDTQHFEDAWYDFQIKFLSVDGLQDAVVGQGKIRCFKEL